VVSILESAKFSSRTMTEICQTDYDADAENVTLYKVDRDNLIKYL